MQPRRLKHEIYMIKDIERVAPNIHVVGDKRN